MYNVNMNPSKDYLKKHNLSIKEYQLNEAIYYFANLTPKEISQLIDVFQREWKKMIFGVESDVVSNFLKATLINSFDTIYSNIQKKQSLNLSKRDEMDVKSALMNMKELQNKLPSSKIKKKTSFLRKEVQLF